MGKDNKIVRIGISHDQRMKNQLGDGYVPCEVSGRYLHFKGEDKRLGYVMVDVRTQTENGDKLLCELILHKKDLVRALSNLDE
ncbi:hypothetical protein [Paenibacillus silvae]|uniref:Uncharacterized protein n=1 Tax=Paenibacillus silvae TaxID=1325358 RepID=A0A2W6NNE4_9BACL|nr:hypothetical protein [Paenibacillus silvae]PZT57379.1 hypothetical protein DN757_01605 [Paenibacillus silvae]